MLNINKEKSNSKIYGFHINPSESDPFKAITYIEDAVGKTPVSINYDTGVINWGDWSEDEFFIPPRHCMFKYGMTVYDFLNAMMEWGKNSDKIWYKVVSGTDNTNGASIYISNAQADNEYKVLEFL